MYRETQPSRVPNLKKLLSPNEDVVGSEMIVRNPREAIRLTIISNIATLNKAIDTIKSFSESAQRNPLRQIHTNFGIVSELEYAQMATAEVYRKINRRFEINVKSIFDIELIILTLKSKLNEISPNSKKETSSPYRANNTSKVETPRAVNRTDINSSINKNSYLRRAVDYIKNYLGGK